MKDLFIADLLARDPQENSEVAMYGWVASVRKFKKISFFTLCDSTGKIEVLTDNTRLPRDFQAEQSVLVQGKIGAAEKYGNKRIAADSVTVVGTVDKALSPTPRSDFDAFDAKYTNYVQENKHLFIRNPKIMATVKAHEIVKSAVCKWFASRRFTEITAPILTPVLLYSEDTGIKVNVNRQEVFLTQCAAFYLESAVHAFERVYTIGPSFRGAESVSPRHLTEYWHVKAEVAFCSFEEMFSLVESLLTFVAEEVAPQSEAIVGALGIEPIWEEMHKTPFPRISYREAIRLCNENGIEAEFGRSLGGKAENFLTEYFRAPVWVTHNARSIEGFPYKVCAFDDALTYTADLIGSCGGGEILGIADKITDYDELQERLREKGKDKDENYAWYKELRRYGTVPHCGVGMGLERLVRWLFRLPHVREAIPFPRVMRRKMYP